MNKSTINGSQENLGEKMKPVEIHPHFVEFRGNESTKCDF